MSQGRDKDNKPCSLIMGVAAAREVGELFPTEVRTLSEGQELGSTARDGFRSPGPSSVLREGGGISVCEGWSGGRGDHLGTWT